MQHGVGAGGKQGACDEGDKGGAVDLVYCSTCSAPNSSKIVVQNSIDLEVFWVRPVGLILTGLVSRRLNWLQAILTLWNAPLQISSP